MVFSTVMKVKNSTTEFMSLTLTMITLNLYDERYFMTKWKYLFPIYTDKKIARLAKNSKCKITIINNFGNEFVKYKLIKEILNDYDDDDKIWTRKENENKNLPDKLLKDLKDENKIEVKSRFQRKYLFESPKQKKQLFKSKNISFKPQRYQIRRNQF